MFYRTWHGRLIFINAAVFLYTCWASGSIFLPDTETLIALGAKDPVRLAEGDWWRLLTPIFLHAGAIHFAVNSYMLAAIGSQLEMVLGGPWFLGIYLLSGVFGNIASAVVSPNLSAGASGAIFGLLGAGLFLERSHGNRMERLTGQRPPNRAYLLTVAINLGFGFIVPFIDNAAHVGGLIGGFVTAAAMVRLRPNRIVRPHRKLGIAILAALVAVVALGIRLGTSPEYLRRRLVDAAEAAEDPREGAFYYTQAIEIDARAFRLKLARARLFFKLDEPRYALYDVREALASPEAVDDVELLARELESEGKFDAARNVRLLLERQL